MRCAKEEECHVEVLTDTNGACLENTIDEPEKFGETRRTVKNIKDGARLKGARLERVSEDEM